ncbi:unnamed protein product [Leuciscus chuanchicus]
MQTTEVFCASPEDCAPGEGLRCMGEKVISLAPNEGAVLFMKEPFQAHLTSEAPRESSRTLEGVLIRSRKATSQGGGLESPLSDPHIRGGIYALFTGPRNPSRADFLFNWPHRECSRAACARLPCGSEVLGIVPSTDTDWASDSCHCSHSPGSNSLAWPIDNW